MMGKRKPTGTLFDVGNVFPFRPKSGTFHAQLAEAAPRLFQDEAFQELYDPRRGRYSVPPSELALLLLLQAEAGCSDEEALERSACDLRWGAVLRKAAGEPLCAKSTFQAFRARLVLEERADAVLKTSLEEAKRAGLLKGAALTLAVDTKPIIGRGAVLDTYNLLGRAIQKLSTALAVAQDREPEAWAKEHDLARYFSGRESSLKGSTELDWADPRARGAFLAEIVGDARRLWRQAHDFLRDLPPLRTAVEQGWERRVREAYELLGQLLRQDIEESTGPGGGPQARIKEGTAPERVPSVTDPEQRHGRKSQSKRFTGHKLRIGVDVGSGLIAAVEVLAGNAGDAAQVLEAVAQAEANTELPVAETLGDCAFGGGETRQEFADAERTLYAKVPQPAPNGAYFPKRAFTIDLAAGTVSCPGGQTTTAFREDGQGTRIFQFGARCQGCPLRAQCTAAAGGRTLQVHAQEALLQAARAFQTSPAGQAKLRERVVVEHGLARMAQRGVGQAKYCGRGKTRFQMVVVAAVVNLRLVWNRAGAGATTGGDGGADRPTSPGFWVRIRRWVHQDGGSRLGPPRWRRFSVKRCLHGCGAATC
jgi:DDE family transposase/transposase-like protein DUF772